MLTAISVKNVRLFSGDDEWRFNLAPLTVLCGTNSAGKSTLAKIPLLLRQSHGIGEGVQSNAGILRLVGNQVDAGTYPTFVSGNQTDLDVELGVEIEDRIEESLAAALKLWRATDSPTGFAPPARSGAMLPYKLRVRFVFGLRSKPITKKTRTSDTKAKGEAKKAGAAIMKRALFELSVQGDKLVEWQVLLVPDPADREPGPPRYEIVLPTVLLQASGWRSMLDAEAKKGAKTTSYPVNLLGLLPIGMQVRVKQSQTDRKASRQQRVTFSVWPLPVVVNGAIQDLRTALSDVHYLGPLRAPPKRYYVAQAAADPGMDAAGDFLPYVLRDRGADLVVHSPPGADTFLSEPLAIALNRWMYYLRTGEVKVPKATSGEVSIQATNEILVEFGLKSNSGGRTHALADSGFGYSQVLPVIVRGLLAGRGSLLVVEQPELHLNPGLQIRLGEFFVGLARAGKQVMIETHSEHIVNAVRVIAAESAERVPCSVFFLDATRGVPEVHRMDIGETGMVEHWPINFFGETASLRGRLLRAQRRLLVPSE